VSGDLPGDQNFPLLIGSFASGTNTVVGHESIDSDTAPGQGDTFGLTLSAGQHIDSIVLHVTDNTNTADGFGLTIFQSPFTQVDQQELTPGGGGDFTFTPFATQSPGKYNFSTRLIPTTSQQMGLIGNGTSTSLALLPFLNCRRGRCC
jgi:hypothetical protein